MEIETKKDEEPQQEPQQEPFPSFDQDDESTSDSSNEDE